MKNLVFILCLFILPTLCLGQSLTALVVWHKDGTSTEVAFKTKPTVRFSDKKMIVESEGSTMEFDCTELLRITYGEMGSGITEPHVEPQITVSHGELVLRHIDPTTPITVHTVSGQPATVSLRRQADTAWISLSHLPKGVYVIKAGNKNIKYSKP